MCKALKQNPSERAKSYQHQVSDLFKDAHNLFKLFSGISQPCFPLTPLKNTWKTESWFISWQLPYRPHI